jgi:hypothetical protein
MVMDNSITSVFVALLFSLFKIIIIIIIIIFHLESLSKSYWDNEKEKIMVKKTYQLGK